MKIAFFGGTGGLGSQVTDILSKKHMIDKIGSKVVNITKENEISNYFYLNNDVDAVVIFSAYNYNSFLHKYKHGSSELQTQIDTNIAGVTRCVSHALNLMRNRKFGRIIIASSVTVDRSVMGTSIYAAAKAYYENIVKTIAIENASLGITANCLQLGYMDGGLTYTLPEEFLQTTIKQIPSQRLGSSEEIANAIEFLLGNEYVNGSVLKLTGGL